MPGRTDNEIKNYWNTHIKRKLYSRGIDPQTHRPLNSLITTCTSNKRGNNSSSNNTQITTAANDNMGFQIKMQTTKKKQEVADLLVMSDINNNENEDSNSSSGVTTEEIYPELNLELSIGLPAQHGIISSSCIKVYDKCLKQNGKTGVCLCCCLGFQKSEACSCKSMVMAPSITTAPENNLCWYYSWAMDSWNLGQSFGGHMKICGGNKRKEYDTYMYGWRFRKFWEKILIYWLDLIAFFFT